MIRRLAFVLVFIPFTLYAAIIWLITGKPMIDQMDALESWVDR